MLMVLSPSKTLNFTDKARSPDETIPEMLDKSVLLIKELRKYSTKKLSKLMDISDKLSELNVRRYELFDPKFTNNNAKQALEAFEGDVYEPMKVATYTAKDFEFAQKHLRILSGLYGVLKPMDLMQPYRLEMGTGLKNPKGKDLYAFWGDSITQALNEAMKNHKNMTLINLASVEYFQSVMPHKLDGKQLKVSFKEKQKGQIKIVALFAKKARGMMADFVIRNRIDQPEGLKDFNGGGYQFKSSLSVENEWQFVR